MTNASRRRQLARLHAQRAEQRREAARRRRRRLQALGGGLAGIVVIVVVVVVVLVTTGGGSGSSPAAAASASATPAAATTCSYPASSTPAAKDVGTPPTERPTGTTTATLDTSVGTLTLSLDATGAPCTVNSFSFLANKGYFDNTSCHRLTTSGIFVLQCGDPSGTGSGGPGYTFDDENLTNATYTAGTVAMANSGANTNGSQFFIVYKDSTTLPADYTPFGTVTSGLDLVQKVADAGVADGSTDGKPKTPVTITSATTTPLQFPTPSPTPAESTAPASGVPETDGPEAPSTSPSAGG